MQMTYRMNEEDAILLQYYLNHHHFDKIGDALSYIIEDVSRLCEEEHMNWLNIKDSPILEIEDIQLTINNLGTQTFYVDDQVMMKVLNSAKDAFHLSKVNISFVIKLCIKEAVLNLNNKNRENDTEILIRKLSELLLLKDEKSLNKIKNILESEEV